MILAGLGGGLLGLFFFGGLWWTVHHATRSPHPARWFLASLLLRTSVTCLGFYLLGGADWQRWAACLLGFTLARWLLTRHFSPAGGPRHAP